MCGLAGFWALGAGSPDAVATVRRMTDALRHRGPDDDGYWYDATANLALGHRRLSIVDLSPTGHQPMASRDERYVVTFNGEIYNHRELRADLAALGHRFVGRADTEVLLAAVSEWGLSRAVRRLVGMFAFALWDGRERRLHLVRDRIGEKPLYYTWAGSTLLFGSELKALRRHPDWRGTIDRGVLAVFLRYGYIPAPYSVYEAVWKVWPGTVLSFEDGIPGTAPRREDYWSLSQVAIDGDRHPAAASDDELVDSLEALLRTAVRQAMVADVPVGAFLSGGIDSSLVVALMQAESLSPTRTFTIGFPQADYDEARHARAVAAYLGTAHTELYVTEREAQAVIPRLPSLYDEPFADASQIPMVLVSELARTQVTVSLSGDGGDELFAGYDRYLRAARLWRAVRPLPPAVRRLVAGGVDLAARGAARTRPAWLGGPERSTPAAAVAGDRPRKLAAILGTGTVDAVYRELVSQWREPARVVVGATERATVLTSPEALGPVTDPVHRMMYLDATSYLPDDIMVKVDRATMSVGLESRAPLLDHRVVEAAWRLPRATKVRDNKGKWILRQILGRYLPPALFDRPKMGFGVPVGEWLRGPLREWAADLLSPARLAREGFLDPAAVSLVWREHQRGSRDRQFALWTVLMLQAWLAEQ